MATETLEQERDRLNAAVTEICETLRGVSNTERLILHEQRKDFRARLAEIEVEFTKR